MSDTGAISAADLVPVDRLVPILEEQVERRNEDGRGGIDRLVDELHAGMPHRTRTAIVRRLYAWRAGEQKWTALGMVDDYLQALGLGDELDRVLGGVVTPLLTCEDCGKAIEPGDYRPLELFRPQPDAPADIVFNATTGKWVESPGRARKGGRRFRTYDLCRRCAGEALRKRAMNGDGSNGRGRRLRARDRIPPRRGGRPRLLTDRQIEAAHVLYKRGLSVREVAELLLKHRFKGTSGGLASALHYGFKRLSLPVRSRSEACSTWHRKKGHLGKQRRPRCAGVKNNKRPCSLPARAGSDFCWGHDPKTREQVLAHTRSIRRSYSHEERRAA